MQLKFKDAFSGKKKGLLSERQMEQEHHRRNQTISEKVNRQAMEQYQRTMYNRDFLFK